MKAAILIFLGTVFGSSVFPAASEALLVLSKRDHTLAIVDPATLKVIAKAPVGEDPHEVIASADGTLAYVSNYGGGLHNQRPGIRLCWRRPIASVRPGGVFAAATLLPVGR